MKRKAEISVILEFMFYIALPVCVVFGGLCALHASNKPHCEKCIRLENAIDATLSVIYKDCPDYYMDILVETEEFQQLNDLLHEIPDSSKKKMREVFPDIESSKP